MLRWRSSVQQLRIFLVLLSTIPGEIVLYGSMFKSPRQRHSSRAAVASVAARASTVRRKPKRKRNCKNRGRANSPKRKRIAFTQVSNAPKPGLLMQVLRIGYYLERGGRMRSSSSPILQLPPSYSSVANTDSNRGAPVPHHCVRLRTAKQRP